MTMKTIWLIIIAALGLSMACGLGGQTDEANKLVNESNEIIKANNDDNIKAGKLVSELLGENLKKVEDFEEYKTTNKAKFDELTALNAKIEKGGADAVAKFEQAAKLKIDDKFKEYLTAKVAEWNKRGEYDKLTSSLVKDFLAAKDAGKIDSLLGDYNKKSSEIQKQVEDLMNKADKIAKDNPGSISGK
jgi:peptidoglycan hydrolase CwlO-like protein